MRLPTDILAAALLVAAVAIYRRRGERAYAVVAALLPLVIAIDVAQNAPRVVWALGPQDVILAVLALVQVAAILGLPPGIARLVGFGLRNRQWEFDLKLERDRGVLDRAIDAYPLERTWESYRRWQSSFLATGKRTIEHMKRLTPPDADWSAVRDGYVALYEEIFDRVERDELPDDGRTLERGGQLKHRADALRRQYHAAAEVAMRRRSR